MPTLRELVNAYTAGPRRLQTRECDAPQYPGDRGRGPPLTLYNPPSRERRLRAAILDACARAAQHVAAEFRRRRWVGVTQHSVRLVVLYDLLKL